MIQTFTYFGAESASGIGTLGINGRVFLVQLITFVLAFLVLRKFAFGPILRVLDQRRETIEKGVMLGEAMEKEKAELDKQVTEELRKARMQADEIVAQANDVARSSSREAEEKARLKAEGIITDAHSRIEQDVKHARKELEKDIVSLISDATEVIIDEKVDAKKDAALIDRALKERARA